MGDDGRGNNFEELKPQDVSTELNRAAVTVISRFISGEPIKPLVELYGLCGTIMATQNQAHRQLSQEEDALQCALLEAASSAPFEPGYVEYIFAYPFSKDAFNKTLARPDLIFSKPVSNLYITLLLFSFRENKDSPKLLLACIAFLSTPSLNDQYIGWLINSDQRFETLSLNEFLTRLGVEKELTPYLSEEVSADPLKFAYRVCRLLDMPKCRAIPFDNFAAQLHIPEGFTFAPSLIDRYNFLLGSKRMSELPYLWDAIRFLDQGQPPSGDEGLDAFVAARSAELNADNPVVPILALVSLLTLNGLHKCDYARAVEVMEAPMESIPCADKIKNFLFERLREAGVVGVYASSVFEFHLQSQTRQGQVTLCEQAYLAADHVELSKNVRSLWAGLVADAVINPSIPPKKSHLHEHITSHYFLKEEAEKATGSDKVFYESLWQSFQSALKSGPYVTLECFSQRKVSDQKLQWDKFRAHIDAVTRAIDVSSIPILQEYIRFAEGFMPSKLDMLDESLCAFWSATVSLRGGLDDSQTPSPRSALLLHSGSHDASRAIIEFSPAAFDAS